MQSDYSKEYRVTRLLQPAFLSKLTDPMVPPILIKMIICWTSISRQNISSNHFRNRRQEEINPICLCLLRNFF